MNSIAKFSLLDRWELMFAFRCGLEKENRALPPPVSPRSNSSRKICPKFDSFNSVSDWEAEIQRLERAYNSSNSISKFFRISHVNGKFVCVESYPEVVVVPRTLVDSTIATAAGNFGQQRFPVRKHFERKFLSSQLISVALRI